MWTLKWGWIHFSSQWIRLGVWTWASDRIPKISPLLSDSLTNFQIHLDNLINLTWWHHPLSIPWEDSNLLFISKALSIWTTNLESKIKWWDRDQITICIKRAKVESWDSSSNHNKDFNKITTQTNPFLALRVKLQTILLALVQLQKLEVNHFLDFKINLKLII